jgi:hypothetical protein
MVEFKRAHLFNFNPVGYLSMIVASAENQGNGAQRSDDF